MPAPINPFTEDDSSMLNTCLENCQALKDFYRKCDGCGLDVSDLKDRLAKQEAFFEAVKREFMPRSV